MSLKCNFPGGTSILKYMKISGPAVTDEGKVEAPAKVAPAVPVDEIIVEAKAEPVEVVVAVPEVEKPVEKKRKPRRKKADDGEVA